MNAPERIDTTALTQETQPLLVPANFKITSPEQYTAAGFQLTGIKTMLKKIAETFDPHIKRAHDAHKALVTEKRTHETPLLTAESTLKRALLGFQQEQERVRREQEAKAQAEARKQQEKLLAQAERLAEKGKAEQAEAKREQAAVVPTPVIAVETPRVAGIATRTTHRAEVTDLDALVAAVASGKVPKLALIPNEKFLNEQARSYKSALNWPGVKVVEDQGISSRSS
jgi:hypothetical protein